MGADFNIKPVGAPVATPVIRPAPEAVREAVPTQLPPDKTVSAAPRVLQPNISAANYQQVDSDRISKEVIIDKGAGEIVYRLGGQEDQPGDRSVSRGIATAFPRLSARHGHAEAGRKVA
jgi:hypothetical protein